MGHIVRTTFRYFSIALAIASIGVGVPKANAQSDKDQHDCKKAIQIVARGKPDKKEEWAWATVLGCGAAGGVAARDAWMQARTEVDTRSLEELYSRLWSFRDSALFNAAHGIFADAVASPQGRVYSAMLLVSLLFDAQDPTYEFFSSTKSLDICRTGSVAGRIVSHGGPLPSDAEERTRRAAQTILHGSTAPAIVVSAAHCVDQGIRMNEWVRAHPYTPPTR